MDLQPIKTYWRTHRKATIVVVSGLLYAGGWSIGHFSGLNTTSALILILGAIVGGYAIAKTTYYEIRSQTLGIKTLVTLAAISAILIGS